MSAAKIYTAHGKSLTMRQWAKELNLPQKTLRNRLDRGVDAGSDLHTGKATAPGRHNRFAPH